VDLLLGGWAGSLKLLTIKRPPCYEMEIKCICYHSVQNVLSSCFLFYLWFCIGVKLGLCSLREEHRLRALKNKMLTIFGSKMEEITGNKRKLHNEFHNLYFSQNAYKSLVGKPREKKPLGRPRCKYDNNIKLY
jgi:hypothetical protein